MNKIYAAFLFALVALGCKTKKTIPNVAGIKIELTTQRFEQDYFLMDTTNTDAALQKLYEKYPLFMVDYLQNILAIPPQPDSAIKIVQEFTKAYRPVYQESSKQYSNFSATEAEIKQAFQFVKHYFPQYKLPTQLVTYIGPWDAAFLLAGGNGVSTVMRDDSIMGIGLQLALGGNNAFYTTAAVQQMYPRFISRRFAKEYIAVNAIKVIIDDLYQSSIQGKPLVEQMVEAGKRLYLLDAFMPTTADTLKTGYTANQLKGCYASEKNIWSFFITNDLLFATEPALIQEYITDGPKTNALGDDSPGFIGQFIGWRIVQQWMNNKGNIGLEQLLKTSAKQIFEESRYKP